MVDNHLRWTHVRGHQPDGPDNWVEICSWQTLVLGHSSCHRLRRRLVYHRQAGSRAASTDAGVPEPHHLYCSFACAHIVHQSECKRQNVLTLFLVKFTLFSTIKLYYTVKILVLVYSDNIVHKIFPQRSPVKVFQMKKDIVEHSVKTCGDPTKSQTFQESNDKRQASKSGFYGNKWRY